MDVYMNELELYDIYGHWHQPFWQTQWFRMLLMIIAALFILGLLLFLFKKFYKQKSLSATQKALRDLEHLKSKKIVTREDAHAAYFSLTSILKTFFQSYFGQRYESMSDYEMIANLRINGMPSDQMTELENIINDSLSVKYARENALHDDVMRAISNSIAIIKQTTTKKN
jgi:hypothetical protein